MAIKGKSKRNHSRSPRHPSPGPRPQNIVRPSPWYQHRGWAIGLGVFGVLLSLCISVRAVGRDWRRSDVRSFEQKLTGTLKSPGPLRKLSEVVNGKDGGTAGMTAAVASFDAGELDAVKLKEQASQWQLELRVADVNLQGFTPSGRLAELADIKDLFRQSLGLYLDAAGAYQLAADQKDAAVQASFKAQATEMVSKAQRVYEDASNLLGKLRGRLGLPEAPAIPSAPGPEAAAVNPYADLPVPATTTNSTTTP